MHEAVKVYPDGREVCTGTVAGRRLYRDRLVAMCIRQGFVCAICKVRAGMGLREMTFDHEAGRGMGGSRRTDEIEHPDGIWRNAALCLACNGIKGSRRYSWQSGQYLPVVRSQESEAA